MPRAPSDASSDEPVPVLEQVLPLLMLGDHLTADSKLACIGASRGMAELLLRNTACTKLKLNLGGATAAGGSTSSSSSSGSSSSPALFKAAQQLAAQSSNVALALHGGLLTPAACLWQRITSIHLDGVQLSPKDVSSHSQLQLHRLPRLHTLSLQACRINADSGPAAGNPHGRAAASSIRTLKCVRCTPSSASLLLMALSLVDPGQLQTLITDDNAATDFLAQLPVLQEYQLQSTEKYIRDNTFQQLLQHPGLTRVSLGALGALGSVWLEQDYSGRPCGWASLTLTSGVNAQYLAALPLAQIQCCTVQGNLSLWCSRDQLNRAISNANSCPRLVFEPTIENCRWTPAQPMFGIFNVNGQGVADSAIPLVMRHLSGGGLLMNARITPSLLTPAMVAALAAAPPTITTIEFPINSVINPDVAITLEAGEVEQGVCTNLPAHITHVVISVACGWDIPKEQWRRRILPWFMKGLARPLRLTFLVTFGGYAWPQDFRQEVQEWLDTHANQVQVDFQTRTMTAAYA